MTLGDSKTASAAWLKTVVAALPLPSGLVWALDDGGVSGSTVASSAASIATVLAGMDDTGDPVSVLCNWGANDVNVLPAEATWKANYLAIIDACVAKWPQAKVYLTRPWRRGYAIQCNTLAAWIADIVAARPGIAFAGDDERVWLESGDNGAAMTSDGIHYSAAGQAAKALQVKSVLGY